ncbi:hypothetical protein OYC64_001272 [Pagothenia borchgrevinki]|uniref:Immunoglobulin V-set domain-containing protein n=1 Tax=Pagothenia borchgrevinki TaxID=8213 RepID=A0ABD2GAF4_PAGBO
MKNGDASILLKNVNTNDTGTYECRVITRSNNRRRRDVGNRELVRSTLLSVSEGPEKEIKNEHHQYGDANDEPPGGPGGYAVLGVSVGLVCLVVIVVLVVKCQRARRRDQKSVSMKRKCPN